MLRLGSGLLEDLSQQRDDDRVGGNDQRRLAELRVVELGGIDGGGFLGGGLQDILEGREGLGESFRDGGGDDFEVRETYLDAFISAVDHCCTWACS